MLLFLGASSCASAASWVISSVCLQIDNREVFCDPRSNRNSVKNCIFREKLIEIILKITAKSFSLVASCHSSFIVLFYLLTRPEPPCTHLHPGCQLCVFSSNRARLEVGCAASNAAYPPVIIKLTYLGICFSIYVTAFHAFRFMRAVSKRWRTCLSPSRTRRALRRRSNSVYQGKSSRFKQRHS